MKLFKKIFFTALVALSLTGCQTNSAKQAMLSGSQVELRSYQVKEFHVEDGSNLNRNVMMRAVVATLQDLGFVLDKADEVIGVVTAKKFDRGVIAISVTVVERGARITVRANAQYGLKAVEEPEPYQEFFSSLDKGLFLETNLNN